MGRVYKYSLWPKDESDARVYFWDKPDSVDKVGYDETGARASFSHGRYIYVINGYVEGIEPIFSYRIDKRTFLIEEIDIKVNTDIGESSQCFIDAASQPDFKLKDMKLIMRGGIKEIEGARFNCVCDSTDPVFTGKIYLSFTVDIHDNVTVAMNALVYSPSIVLEEEEILDNIGMYNGLFYFIGRQAVEVTWRNLWIIDTGNNNSVGMQVLLNTDFPGRQSFALNGRYAFATGGSTEGNVPLWVINLVTKLVAKVDYTTALLKLPSPIYNPVITNRGTQILVLGPSTSIEEGAIGEVVRVDSVSLHTVGLETLTSDYEGDITANNGIVDVAFHYYFDTRRGLLWMANIIDAVPFDTTVQLFDYECKFNGVVLMAETIHSKIDDNKYIFSYK